MLTLLQSCRVTTLLLLTMAADSYHEGDSRVFMTRDEAFRVILPGADRIVGCARKFSPDAKARIEKRASRRMREGPASGSDTVTVWIGYRNGDTIGYAMILDEIGLHHPITFGIGLRPDGTLRDCVVMVFRESYGAEIKDIRFRRQFFGKGARDPIRINRDVITITGATYSARAATDVIRKAIAIYTELYQ